MLRPTPLWPLLGPLLVLLAPAAAQKVRLPAELQRDLSAEAAATLHVLLEPDSKGSTPAARRAAVRRLLTDAAAREPLRQVLDLALAALERRYAQLLEAPVRAAYHGKLRTLSPEDLRTVARTRRMWRSYLLHTTTQHRFQKNFLQPAVAVGKLLFPDVTELQTKASRAQRLRMLEYAAYRDDVREALGLGADPTTGVKAPTGIPLPPLTTPRDYEAHLDHLHRTIAIAASVAPLEAWEILLANADKARFIDHEEAEFVLMANEVRMAMGTIAWATDILACAATRDHSKDRADGKAKGHWSSIPGKTGFTHRLRRFGTSGASEGAGGGSNGRGYLHGLSYGGGHTGPLYSLKRNVVGVGRYGNVYTSTYATDRNAVHTCQVLLQEQFMPPGLSCEDLGAPGLTAVCSELRAGAYARAAELLTAVEAETEQDKLVCRYLKIAIDAEADWRVECITRIAAAGDLLGAEQRIAAARQAFGATLDRRLAPFEKRMRTKAGRAVLDAGRAYADACARKDDRAIRAVITDHAGTVYAKAAGEYLAPGDRKGRHPLSFFLTVDAGLNRFEYLAP